MHPWILAALTAVSVQFASREHGVTLTASLYEPAGATASAPAPAVVVLHTCAGIDDTVLGWASWLAQNGYVALVPDSFGPRRVDAVCGTRNVPVGMRAKDAYGALDYLRTRPEVDGTHVGEIGFSHGGGTVLWTEGDREVTPGFAAAIALYPSACAQHPATSLAFPFMLLIGADDDWTDARTCVDFIHRIDPNGTSSIVHVYPGAYHKFDDPLAHKIARVGPYHYTLQYNEEAAEDAHARVLAFFKQYL